MKTSQLLLAVLLGLGASGAACAQTVPGAPGSVGVPGAFSTPSAPGTVGSTIEGQPSMPNTSLPTSPVITTTAPSTLYSPGTAPTDALSTPRTTQPLGTSISTSPSASPSALPTRPARRATPRAHTTNTPVQP